ncbi:MAG: protein rep, partial [Candidatus Marinimicrobia bacterium]|nr:protein rep [Candidatus Neomarinimicrobiota bacterium]
IMLGNKAKTSEAYNRRSVINSNPSIVAFKDSIDSLTDASQDNLINNFELRDTAASIMTDQRVFKCGKVPTSSNVEVLGYVNTDKTHYSGLQSCGSVWACPVCASKISERRRLEVSKGIDESYDMGLEALLITLTFPHSRTDNLKELLRKQSLASRLFKERAAYKRMRKEYGIKGTIRALETTHSNANGWHPHLHELWFIDRGFSISMLRKKLHEAWSRACVDAGLERPSLANGVDVRAGDFAADYVSKWGMDCEIAKAHVKKGKKGESRSPFQMLADYKQGDMQAGALFREYAEAFKGKRQLVWSKGLKALFGIEQKSDKEVLDECKEKAIHKLSINRADWSAVVRHNAQAYVLILAGLRSKREVYQFIDQLRRTGAPGEGGNPSEQFRAA